MWNDTELIAILCLLSAVAALSSRHGRSFLRWHIKQSLSSDRSARQQWCQLSHQFAEYGENIDRQEWVEDYGLDRSWTVSVVLSQMVGQCTPPSSDEELEEVPGYTFMQTAGNMISLKLNGSTCELLLKRAKQDAVVT